MIDIDAVQTKIRDTFRGYSDADAESAAAKLSSEVMRRPGAITQLTAREYKAALGKRFD